jgi:hypothetical protein
VPSIYINRGSFYSIESLSYINQTAVIGVLAPYKKNQSLSKKFKIDGAASTIGGCASENNF